MNGKQHNQRRNRWDSVVRQLLASPAPPRSGIVSARPTYQPTGVILSADKSTRQQLQMGLIRVGFRVVTSHNQDGTELLKRRGWNLVLIQNSQAMEAENELISLACENNRGLTVVLTEENGTRLDADRSCVLKIVQKEPLDTANISRQIVREYVQLG